MEPTTETSWGEWAYEYDENHCEVYVIYRGEAAAMIEDVTSDAWQQIVRLVDLAERYEDLSR